MKARRETEIVVNFKPRGVNELKIENEKSEWKGRVDKMQDLFTGLLPSSGHYTKAEIFLTKLS